MILLLNYENALLQPNLTAVRILAAALGIPDAWVVVRLLPREGGGVTTEANIFPPPDGRLIAPKARFYAMTQAEVTAQVAKVMGAAKLDRIQRMQELDAFRTRGL